jgi:glucose-1-phosphate cytidylyltransferase
MVAPRGKEREAVKVVILAGGYGTRISEESHLKPKPMIDIGEKPILWHILKIYAHYGYRDFVVCLGYKGYFIKEYFAHYLLHESDVTFDFADNHEAITYDQTVIEPWRVSLVNTGLNTMTAGRIKRIRPYIGNEPFMLTYGDGVARIDINELVAFHRSHGKLATVTATQPTGRFGALQLDEGGGVTGFQEKPPGDCTWINAGYFVFEPGIFDYIKDDSSVLEQGPLETLARDGQLMAFRHRGFWHPMDHLRDKNHLETLWQTGAAPWKVWD